MQPAALPTRLTQCSAPCPVGVVPAEAGRTSRLPSKWAPNSHQGRPQQARALHAMVRNLRMGYLGHRPHRVGARAAGLKPRSRPFMCDPRVLAAGGCRGYSQASKYIASEYQRNS